MTASRNKQEGPGRRARNRISVGAGLAIAMLTATTSHAERIENKVAVFSALDKVTASIKKLEIPLGETVKFGALTVTPRACYSRPPTEQPKTTSFVEVDEIQLDGTNNRLFTGWMFAESPGLNAVEHPVFDVWLTGCEKPTKAFAREAAPGKNPDAGTATPENPETLPRRRVRR